MNLNVLLKSLNKALGNGNVLWIAGAFAFGIVASKYILPTNLFGPPSQFPSAIEQQQQQSLPPQQQQQEPVQEIFDSEPQPVPLQQRVNIANTEDLPMPSFNNSEDIKIVDEY